MRRLVWLWIVFVLGVVPVTAQSYPETDALIEAAFAKDVGTVMKHLPTALQKALAELPAHERDAIGQQFLISKNMAGDGVSITRPSDGRTLAIIEEKGEDEGKHERVEVTLDKRVSDGYESVLRLKLQRSAERGPTFFTVLIWMRFEDGEWRIMQVQPSEGREYVNFEDTKFLADIRGSRIGANQSSAVASLRTYATACITYSVSFPEIGYPETLEVLGGDSKEESSKHSGLVDPVLSTPPYEKSGYRFTYTRTKPGTDGAFRVVARPIEFGVTGKSSFFVDETAVIRATEEDREATASDEPL